MVFLTDTEHHKPVNNRIEIFTDVTTETHYEYSCDNLTALYFSNVSDYIET